MPQVVDSSNLVQLVTTGSVPDFKPPEAVKAEPKPGEPPEAKTADTSKPNGEAKPEGGEAKADAGKSEPARDETGKFVKADEAKGESPKPGDDEDAELTEKVRKIIGKKHRAMKEAEEFARESDARAEAAQRRADAAERELQRLRGGKSDGPKSGEEGGSDPDEPKPGDFKTVGEYTRALTKYEVSKAAKEAKANASASKQQEQANATLQAFGERQDAFRKEHPDYDDIVSEANLEVSSAATTYLIESEHGPALMLHLSQNPDEASRLRKLSPSRQVAELGKLETRFEKKPDPPPANGNGSATTREVSKAPAPIAPLEAKTTPVQKDPSQMSVSELREFRRQEALARVR